MLSTRCSCGILIKLKFSRQIFEKYSNVKFHENISSGSRVVPWERTDGRTNGRADGQKDRELEIERDVKLIVSIRNFANAPKNILLKNAFDF